MSIAKIKEKKSGKKGLKEKAGTVPKQLLRRGLYDGTERLRGQFRDASQRGQRPEPGWQDGYGGDQIEDAAWKGVRWGTRGVELLLKKKKDSSKATGSALPPDTDFPEAESPIEAPPSSDGGERMQVKTKEAAPRRLDGSRTVRRQPASSAGVASDTPSQERSKRPKIKTRESVQRAALSGAGDTVPMDLERLGAGDPLHSRTGEPRQPLDIKTRDSYIRQQRTASHNAASHQKTVRPAGKLPPASAQGEKEFIWEQGRKEVVKQAGLRHLKKEKAAP